jgi:hypothetical protein
MKLFRIGARELLPEAVRESLLSFVHGYRNVGLNCSRLIQTSRELKRTFPPQLPHFSCLAVFQMRILLPGHSSKNRASDESTQANNYLPTSMDRIRDIPTNRHPNRQCHAYTSAKLEGTGSEDMIFCQSCFNVLKLFQLLAVTINLPCCAAEYLTSEYIHAQSPLSSLMRQLSLLRCTQRHPISPQTSHP